MRTVLIGDVHGCLAELDRLLEEVGPWDQLVFLGDLMDKGPFPVETVRFVHSLEQTVVLMGNHEEKHLRWRRHEDAKHTRPGYINPMRPLPAEMAAQNAALRPEEVDWLSECPTAFEFAPGWVAVHGGLRPGLTLQEQLKNRKERGKVMRLRWVDEDGDHVPVKYDDEGNPLAGNGTHWAQVYDGPLNVVYGHEAHSLEHIRIDHQPQGTTTYGIDTGACHGGRLTALIVDDELPRHHVQVQAARTYKPHPTLVAKQ